MRLTVLQILSVDRLFDLGDVSEYLIVLNGGDNGALRAELENCLHGVVSAELRTRLRVLDRAHIPRGGDGAGWHGQQALKLALADVVRTDTYLMLDGKNHFVRRSGIADFYRDGRPTTVWTATSEYWSKYVRASLEALGVHSEEQAARMMPTTTPYLMLTGEVRSLTDRLEGAARVPLKQAMGRTVWGTEFFLYYAHLVAEGKTDLYVDAPSTVATLFTSWPQDPATVLDVIDRAARGAVPMFGLHRKRLPQLDDEQRRAIDRLWHQELLKPWEGAAWFLQE